MNTHADKTQENKRQSVANKVSQNNNVSESTFQFVDNRPEATAQKKLQEMADHSPQAKQAVQFQSMANNYSSRQQQSIQKKAQPVAGGSGGGNEWWGALPNGASTGVAPTFAGNHLTTVWESPHGGANNHLYATKSAAFHGAFDNLGIQDKSTMNERWTLKQGADRLTMYPDATNNETRVIANHTRDVTETLDRVQGHHGIETARTGWSQIDHYHAGVYVGQVFTKGMVPGVGWAHVVMPHFYALP